MEMRGQLHEGTSVTEVRGVTVDVSRGGALVLLTENVPADPDNAFMVRFVDASGAVIAPEFRWGSVLRSRSRRSDCVVAVKFREPLPHRVLCALMDSELEPKLRARA